jgi:hypothetical protein
MADATVLITYQSKIRECDAAIERAEKASNASLRALIAALALMVWLLYSGLAKTVPLWSFLLPLPVAVAAGRWHGRNRGKWIRAVRLRKLRERGVARLENRWHGEGYTGEEFRIHHHVYDSDLQILGRGSLFELLCTVRTGIGRRWLADYLLKPCSIAAAMARQEAVRELCPQQDLRERVGLLGEFDFQESSGEVFAEWIGLPAAPALGWVRVVALAASTALCGLVLAFFCTNIPFRILAPWIPLPLAILMAIAWFYRKRSKSLNEAASRVGVDIGVVREGIELVAGRTFGSARLQSIQRELSEGGAAEALRELERLTNALADCGKPFFDLPAQALAIRTQLYFVLEKWKQRHGGHLALWLGAWGEFEALLALSGYAWENPDDAFPEFVEGEGNASLTARGLGHPLIPIAVCVRNDVELGPRNRLYVLSGSNMAGKSTLLRSIGVSAVMAAAGAPVRASSLRLSSLEVFASLSIVDSILEGKSKFLAEVERVRSMLERANHVPVLFLIDEILSGTNSRDRRIASEAVVRGLLSSGAIGALSTHDLALTEIAELEGFSGSNVHMSARPGDDPMDFDYLLKAGVTKETNALAIAAMMGVAAGAGVK